jgi:hypothetical protein
MSAPNSRRRPTRKPRPTTRRRRSKAFLGELRRQCRLANKADRSDNRRPAIPPEFAERHAMSAVRIDASLIRALQARARKEKTTVDRLVPRLIAHALQELDDHEAVRAFRARPGRTVRLADVKKRL